MEYGRDTHKSVSAQTSTSIWSIVHTAPQYISWLNIGSMNVAVILCPEASRNKLKSPRHVLDQNNAMESQREISLSQNDLSMMVL